MIPSRVGTTVEGSRGSRVRRYSSKRQRACDFCRSRKQACRIENQLPCRLCRAHAQECTFVERAGPSVQARTQMSISPRLDESSEACPLENGSRNGNVGLPDGSSHVLLPWPVGDDLLQWHFGLDLEPSGDANEAHFGPTQDLVSFGNNLGAQQVSPSEPAMHEEIEMRLPSSDGGSSVKSAATTPGSGIFHDEGRVWQVSGLSADMDPYAMAHHPFDTTRTWYSKSMAVRSVYEGSHPIQFVLNPLPKVANVCPRPDLEMIVTPEIGARLISLFFRFISPHLPIFSLRFPPSPQTSEPYLLAAIYSVAQAFSKFDDYLAIQIIYDPPSSDELRAFAMRAVNEYRNSPSTSLLQTALILALAPPSDPVTPAGRARWSLVGDIVSMSQLLGLYHEPSEWEISAEEIHLRRRLSWVVRSTDVWLAAALGNQMLINQKSWLVAPMTASDFSEDEKSKYQPEVFIQASRLTEIVAKILDDLYSLSAVQTLSRDLKVSLQLSRAIMGNLSQWHDSQFPSTESEDADFEIDSRGALELGWHFSRILLYRAMFRPFYNITKGIDVCADESDLEALTYLRDAAMMSSTAFVRFTSQLSNKHYNSFWPFWSSAAWAAMANFWVQLFITSRTEEEARACKPGLDTARRVLKLQSNSLHPVRMALLRIDSVYWKGFHNNYIISPEVARALESPDKER